jgi:hypothetical protein
LKFDRKKSLPSRRSGDEACGFSPEPGTQKLPPTHLSSPQYMENKKHALRKRACSLKHFMSRGTALKKAWANRRESPPRCKARLTAQLFHLLVVQLFDHCRHQPHGLFKVCSRHQRIMAVNIPRRKSESNCRAAAPV